MDDRIGKRKWPVTSTSYRNWRTSQGHSLTGSHVHWKSGNLSETVKDREVITRWTLLTWRDIRLIESHPFSRPWVTIKVIRLSQAFSTTIFRAITQQLTRFQLTWRVARSLCDSWGSHLSHPGVLATVWKKDKKIATTTAMASVWRSVILLCSTGATDIPWASLTLNTKMSISYPV